MHVYHSYHAKQLPSAAGSRQASAPVKAFTPHGTFTGLQMGENADTERYRVGFFSDTVSAPWPPMEWPEMDARSVSSCTQRGASEQTEYVHPLPPFKSVCLRISC